MSARETSAVACSDTVAVACDHGAVELKALVVQVLQERGLKVLDLGTDGSESVDYPDFADALARAMAEGRASRGVLMCGSGIGISMAANRHRFLRAALVHDNLTARLCRMHNDANVLVMGGRVIGPEVARDCLVAFLETPFEGGRHIRRIEKMS